jgi:catechol 2,3-dioxygenase-like lactoylglutathione lyase family enzyme
MKIPGIHHVTALAGDPQRNLDFYTGVLALRLVKLTVNFDDPGTYHFYFGDNQGKPGTILTFFPWPGAHRGRSGTGQASAICFATSEGALAGWVERLKSRGVEVKGPFTRFKQQVISFHDPDGLQLEIVGCSKGESPAILGFHSVTLSLSGYESSATFLSEGFGMIKTAEEGNRFRYNVPNTGLGTCLDLLCQPDARPASMGVGTIHHVAFRAANDECQVLWREKLAHMGQNVTPILDRQYFRSIYFREPGGVLFEIATDPPGFAIDEPLQTLGTHLKLPRWLEPNRAEIERLLPPLQLPK